MFLNKVQESVSKNKVGIAWTMLVLSALISLGLASIYYLTEYDSTQTEPLLEEFEPVLEELEPVFQKFEPVLKEFEPELQTEVGPELPKVEPVIQKEKPELPQLEPELQERKLQIQKSEPACNGLTLNPEEAASYRNKPVSPRWENFPRLEQRMHADISRIHNRFHTLIFDCPTVPDVSTSGNYSRYNQTLVSALAKFNSANDSPMNVWLRLDQRAEAKVNVSFCTDFAVFANTKFPGTIKGILENSKVLMAYASGEAEEKTSLFYENHEPSWEWYSKQWFDHLSSQGLKFGLIINSAYCSFFSENIPNSIMRRFDDLFYFEEENPSQVVNQEEVVPTLVVSDDYVECAGTIMEKVPHVNLLKYIISEEYVVPWEVAPYPFCLQFD